MYEYYRLPVCYILMDSQTSKSILRKFQLIASLLDSKKSASRPLEGALWANKAFVMKPIWLERCFKSRIQWFTHMPLTALFVTLGNFCDSVGHYNENMRSAVYFTVGNILLRTCTLNGQGVRILCMCDCVWKHGTKVIMRETCDWTSKTNHS